MPNETALARIDINALAVRAIEDKADVEIIERLLAVAKEVRAENAKAAWHEAMSQFQAEAPTVGKSKTAKVQTRAGGSYSYRYAPLEDMIAAARPILAKHGLSVVFETSVTAEQVTARAIVAHAQGHSQVCEFSVPIDLEGRMNPAQQVGSAATYARRYAYQAALGLAPDDDDDGQASGEPIMEREPSRPPIAKPQAKATAPPVQTTNQSGEWFGKIESISKPKDGQGPKGPYKLWYLNCEGGRSFATFSSTVADIASTYIKTGQKVIVEYETTAHGDKATGIYEQTVMEEA